MENRHLKIHVENKIKLWIESDPLVGRLTNLVQDSFSSDKQVLIVGGALRDQLRGVTRKDIDIVIDTSSLDFLANKLPQPKKNFFGGLTFNLDGCPVDIWPLKETFHIKEFNLKPTVENFLAGAPFNLDKIAFDIRQGILFDDGCWQGLERKEIVYAPLNPYFEHIQAVRCVILKKKTNFTLHESAQALLSRVRGLFQKNDGLIDEIDQYLKQVYGMEDISVLDEILTEI